MLKRKRDPTFQRSERERLVDLISKHLIVLESKKNDQASCKAKADEWIRITEEYNSTTYMKREVNVLKNLWDNLKRRAKAVILQQRQENMLGTVHDDDGNVHQLRDSGNGSQVQEFSSYDWAENTSQQYYININAKDELLDDNSSQEPLLDHPETWSDTSGEHVQADKDASGFPSQAKVFRGSGTNEYDLQKQAFSMRILLIQEQQEKEKLAQEVQKTAQEAEKTAQEVERTEQERIKTEILRQELMKKRHNDNIRIVRDQSRSVKEQ